MDDNWILVLVLLGAAFIIINIIALALLGIGYALRVAFNLFAWAATYDFIGIALYILLWVLATPVMLTVCIIGGIFLMLMERGDEVSAPSSDRINLDARRASLRERREASRAHEREFQLRGNDE